MGGVGLGMALVAGAPAVGGAAPAGGVAAALALVQGLPDAVGEGVAGAEARLRDLQAQRQAAQRELKNQRKRHANVARRASGLTDAELLSIITSRAAAKAKASAKSKVKAKAKAKG